MKLVQEKEKAVWYVYVWRIENFSYTWQRANEYILSTTFDTFSGKESTWCLKLYPRGIQRAFRPTKGLVGLHLELLKVHGSQYVEVDYELAFINSDRKPEYILAEKSCLFVEGQAYGFSNFVNLDYIVHTKNSILLPEDTLTIRCRIRIKEKEQIRALAVTTIFVHRQLFLWDTLICNYKLSDITSKKEFEDMVVQNAVLQLKLKKGAIHVQLTPAINGPRIFRLRIGILYSNNSFSPFIVNSYLNCDEKQSVSNFLYAKLELLREKDSFLHSGRLILHCELSYCYHQQPIGYLKLLTFNDLFTLDNQA